MAVENELMEKVKEWRGNANSETDPFDKYVSMFIAYNIFYNLYEKKKNDSLDKDFTSGDSRRATGVIELSEAAQLFDAVNADLAKYLEIIPVFSEEYWPAERLRDGSRGMPIAKTLKTAFENEDKKKTVELLAKLLYKVRCNLVHGAKSYKDTNQRELLQMSAGLLDKVLGHLLMRYNEKYPLNN